MKQNHLKWKNGFFLKKNYKNKIETVVQNKTAACLHWINVFWAAESTILVVSVHLENHKQIQF